jgi:hypothetical protein
MAAGDVPADALTDLRASDNALSFWRLEHDLSNLDTVLAAVASNRERLDKLDYTLIDEAVLADLSISQIRSEGRTPHAVANQALHSDLIELTVQKIAKLAHQMMPLKRERISEKHVTKMLVEALRIGAIDRNKIQAKLLGQIESIKL